MQEFCGKKELKDIKKNKKMKIRESYGIFIHGISQNIFATFTLKIITFLFKKVKKQVTWREKTAHCTPR